MPQFSPKEIILNGKYRIEKLLGEGAFGEVYLATHLNLKALRALKVLRKDGGSGVGATIYGNARRRFLQESKLGAQLGNHPRIIQVMDFDEVEDLMVLALEYAPGGSLRDRLESLREQGQLLPIADALRIAAETAEGLALLHNLDVVHRDLKPGNILFDKEGYAKVADFGLAQEPHGKSQRSVFSQPDPHPGTPGYMSPEQKTPPYDVLTPASDIYALGAVLFEMLTGRSQYMQRSGTRPSELRPGVPVGLDELVMRMLAEHPKDRPWDGAEATRLLQACAQTLEGNRRVQEAANAAEQESAKQARKTAEEKAQRETETARKALFAREKTRLETDPQARQNAEDKTYREHETQLPKEAVPTTQVDTSAADQVGSRKNIPIWGWLLGVPMLLALIFLIVRGVALTALTTPDPPQAPVIEPTAVPAAELNAAPSCTEIGQTWVSPVDSMTLVCVPAGNFTMGSDDGYDAEKPVHEVYLDAYWMDKTEVTNGQYAQCVVAGKCTAPKSTSSFTRDSYYGNASYNDYPVINVNWHQATAYCAWAGRGLPTEAQWEKAARGTDGRKYPWGNDAPGTNLLNYKSVISDTTAVGSYPAGASPYGALDMAGNALEWVADRYSKYRSGGQNNPTGPAIGASRVLRGGSWLDLESYVCASNRRSNPPAVWVDSYGFRCSRSLP